MQMWIALGIFVLTYILLLTLTKIRSYVALCSAAVFVIIGILPLSAVLAEIGAHVPVMEQDMLLYPHIEYLKDFIHSGELLRVAESVTGALK